MHVEFGEVSMFSNVNENLKNYVVQTFISINEVLYGSKLDITL